MDIVFYYDSITWEALVATANDDGWRQPSITARLHRTTSCNKASAAGARKRLRRKSGTLQAERLINTHFWVLARGAGRVVMIAVPSKSGYTIRRRCITFFWLCC